MNTVSLCSTEHECVQTCPFANRVRRSFVKINAKTLSSKQVDLKQDFIQMSTQALVENLIRGLHQWHSQLLSQKPQLHSGTGDLF